MSNEINKFPVPLILKKILKDRMSGQLIVSRKDWKRELFFVHGRLEFATSTLNNESLGEVLLEAGKISKEQLRLALEIRSNVPTKMGEILAKTCDLSMRDIYNGLINQVTKIAAATFPLKEGEWRFIKKKPDIPNPQNLKIKLQDIMREGIKSLTDVSYYKRKFNFRSPVAIEPIEKAAKFLTHEENSLYEKLSEFNNISVKNIVSDIKLPEPIFWRIVILFYLFNIVDFVEFTVDDEEQNKKIAEINEMYHKIKSGQSDYFQLLQSDKITTLEEADEQFGEFTDKFDPEKLNVAPDSTAMRRAREVFNEVQKSHTAARLDIEKKIDVDPDSAPPPELGMNDKIQHPPAAGLDEQEKKPAEAAAVNENKEPEKPKINKSDQVKQAREFFTKANRLHNQKKYFEATSLLQKAVAFDNSKADYFILLGLCQSKMPATKKMAEKSLKKAAQMEPWNADPIFALGQLYKSENLVKKAKDFFEKALAINMEHTLAGKAMEDIGGIIDDKKSLFSFFNKKK
jgi:tetratricopeptide (TPR) repeat protein